MNDVNVAYLCDRKACPGCGIMPNPEFSHTIDIRHAANFNKLDNEFYIENESGMNTNKAMAVEKNDPVNHPSHYCKPGQLECIEKMEAAFGIEFVKHFCLLNAFKYVERCREKDNFKQDIEKAIWYLKRLASYINDEEIEYWIALGASESIKNYAYQYAAEIEITRIRLGDGNEIMHIGYAIAYLQRML